MLDEVLKSKFVYTKSTQIQGLTLVRRFAVTEEACQRNLRLPTGFAAQKNNKETPRGELSKLLPRGVSVSWLNCFPAKIVLDGDDLYLRVNLLFEHPLDRHQRPRQRTRTTAARALITNRERVIRQP